MDFKTSEILGIKIINTSIPSLLSTLKNRILNHTKTFIVTANPEIAVYSEKTPHYKALINNATYSIPDGVGITAAAKILKQPLEQRIPGIDLMHALLELAQNQSFSVFFLGSQEFIAKKTISSVKKSYPNLKISGYCNGYSNLDSACKLIKSSRPDIIFVGLGHPLQEEWIMKHLHHFEKGLFIGVGGSFDVISHQVKRAPYLFRQLGLEWLYRTASQPSRIKRLPTLATFVVKILHQKILSMYHRELNEQTDTNY